MKYLLDSNTCIVWLNHSSEAVTSKLESLNQGEAVICSIVLAELAFGCEKSAPTKRDKNMARIEDLRFRFTSLTFDDRAALEYGRIRAHLASLGTPIGPNDLMIASIALANNLTLVTLVTHNTAEFSRIPALQLEDWQ